MQKGIIGKKLGMTQLFDANGKVVPVTIIVHGSRPCVPALIKCRELDYSLISMSTPAGSCRLMRASTVLLDGFRMSIRRL